MEHMYSGYTPISDAYERVTDFLCILLHQLLQCITVAIKSQERDKRVRKALKALQDNPRLSQALAASSCTRK